MISAVLFDYGGVLSPNGGHGSVRAMLAAVFGIDESAIQVGDMHHALRTGMIGEQAFFDELNSRYGNGQNKLTAEAMHRANKILDPSLEVYALAAALREHGIRTGILSNIFAVTAVELRARGRYDGFDPVVLSCEVGAVKPDRRIYDMALQKLGEPPEKVLFIDDQEKCLAPARQLGFKTLLARNPAQIVADAKAIFKRQNNLNLAV